MNKLHTLLLLLSLSVANAQFFVPDDNFEQYLETNSLGNGIPYDNIVSAAIVNVQILDISNQGITNLSGIQWFASLRELDCSNNNFTDLTLNNALLERLVCTGSGLSTIDVSDLSNLTDLTVSSNNLSSVDVSQNPNLQYLYCGNNNLNTLNISANTNLRVLHAPNNNISSINLLSNNQLTSLNLFDNNLSGFLLVHIQPNLTIFDTTSNPSLLCIQVADVAAANAGTGQYATWTKGAGTIYSNGCSVSFPYTQIPDAAFEQRLIAQGIDSEGVLDGQVLTQDIASITTLNVTLANISDLTGIQDFAALETLIVTNNNLTSMDISENVHLEVLQCQFNDLTSLDVSNNPDLFQLWCNNNQLISLDVSNNLAMQSLRCQNQVSASLTLLNLGSTQNITELRCNGNNLGPILDVSGNFALADFNITNNPDLLCIQVNNVTAANNGTGLYAGWSKDLTATYSANYCRSILTYIPDDGFEGRLISLGLDNVMDNYVLTANISGIGTLNASNANISDLTGIEAFVSLTNLNISINNLASVNISALAGLQELRCNNNSLTSLDVSSNLNLQLLNCQSNLLPSLNVRSNSALQELRVNFNYLTSLDLSNNLSLQILQCSSNDITSLDLSNNPNLVTFSCANNPINSLNVSLNPVLTTFNATFCFNLFCIQVANPVAATNGMGIYAGWSKEDQAFYAEECMLTYVPDDNFEQALIDLGLDTALDNYVLTGGISPLTTLDVSGLGINDLTGIQDFISLVSLDVSNNNLTGRLDLSNSPNIEVLDCSFNNLTRMDIFVLKFMTTLDCRGNDFTLLDLKNKPDLTSMNASENAMLTCIEVDDFVAATDRTGIYALWLKDADAQYSNDCTSAGEDEFDLVKKEMKLYPNPVKSYLYLTVPSQVTVEKITLYDIQGREVLHTQSYQQGIYVGGLQDGVYFAAIKTQAFTVTRKLIVSKQ